MDHELFSKEKEKPLRGGVDYHSLNHITKKNNAHVLRSDDMFAIIRVARLFFSKSDVKAGLHQIRVELELYRGLIRD